MSGTDAHYHVVIVGMDMSGLALGALCAKAGYRVLIIGQGTGGDLYRHGGHTWVRRARLHHGLDSPQARRVFERLSLGFELRNLPRPLDPGYQVVLPSGRVDFTTRQDRFERELRREFGPHLEEIQHFYDRVRSVDAQVAEVLALGTHLPPRGLREGFQFRRLVKRYPFLEDAWSLEDPLAHFAHGHPFRAFASAPFRFVSDMLPARPYPAGFVRVVHELRRGVCTFDAGPEALRDLFIDRVRSGGDVRERAVAVRLELQRGRARRLVLRDRGQAIGCDVLVCNSDPKRFFALIPQEQREEAFHHEIHTLQPVYHTFVANFRVRARGVPEGMGRHVFVIHDLRAPLEDDNLVHVARDADVGTVETPREHRLITATMRVPITWAAGGPDSVRTLLARARARVETVVPFLGEHLVEVHSPWLRETSSGLEIDPAALQPAYAESIPQTLGTTPFATSTGYRNVLLGSDAAYCGLGSDGPWVAAEHLFDQVQQLAGRRGPS